ncbi:DUF2066 domain-containing protein [Halopseudomonas nanhaiensis]|uniref:DUF2066 domain-containing protein n=1 Tax=Halopseudomonas nanhaiensis TaxID=2830842 RepID=UPI001CBFAF32|nr:DUF2066 domain-containing protein [Halopseudomonas nanhaiensis]UAW97539.1 DUF2066 domain-containing protein [Halopseudomonas nanhaiensis]
MPVMRHLLSVFLLPAALASTCVSAAVVEGFYRVELPQDEEKGRDEVIREGVQVMLTRLAGERVERNAASFSRALDDPRSLMRRIANTERGTVTMDFEPAVLREVLSSGGSPMLGRNRPGVLVWAVDAQSLGDEMVGQDSQWADVLRRAAEHRAVPLSFPLADLEDRGRVSESSIRQADDDALASASERYAPEGILAVGARSDDNETELSWTFWLNQQEYSGAEKAEDPAVAADNLMKAVAAAIFDQYAVAASGSELSRWTIVVDEVGTLAEFAGIQRMIQQLGANSSPQLLSVEGDKVTFRLAFPDDEAQLERMLALDHRMQRTEAPPVEPEPPAEPAPLPDIEEMAPEGDVEVTEPAQATSDDPLAQPQADLPDASPAPSRPQPDPNTLYYRWR